MFKDYDKTLKMIEGSYKKLKSYYYYDKSLLYLKHKIAEFENDTIRFHSVLHELARNTVDKNTKYFEDLLLNMDFKVLPKKLKSNISNKEIIKSNVDHKKDIEKLNFFIDLPIELFILDILWMLLVGKIASDNQVLKFEFSYAGRFKKTIFSKYDVNLFSGIDFHSCRCFEPYFNLYSKWKDNAFDEVKEKNSITDTVMISLDLKGFYYSVEFDFDILSDLLNEDPRLEQIEFITKIIQMIYKSYTTMIGQYKKGIKYKENFCIFPIGLLSPIVLRELYLKNLDHNIHNKIQPFYYGRYVDDILIVCDAKGMSGFDIPSLIETFIIRKGIAIPIGDGELKFKKYPNLRIQKDKINCFLFEKNTKDILTDIYNKQIRINSSEANLLPDMDLLNESFNNKAYSITNLGFSNKLRDLGFMKSNNYNATIFVNGLKRILKNTVIDKIEMDIYFNEIIEFYSGSQGIEFSNSWCSVFELFVLCSNKDRANLFYKNIKNYSKILTFNVLNSDEVIKKKQKKILNKLKINLNEHLDIALSLAISLDYKIGKLKKHRDIAKIFRNSNLFNHNLVSIPLINYSLLFNNDDLSLINTNISIMGSEKEMFKLDKEKLKWSPRYINLDEFYICFFLCYFNKSINTNDKGKIYNKYVKYNNLKIESNPITKDELECYGNKVKLRKIQVEDYSKNKTKIGLVNTIVDEIESLSCLDNPKAKLTLSKKQKLFRILNTAKKENINYLAFPEFYLPISWLYDVSKFAKDNGITIITGLQYLTCKDTAYNYTCTVKSSVSKKGFKNSFLFFREKNYYAPDEKLEISKKGYVCKDSTKPFYNIIKSKNVNFSTILCYEFTDIVTRASMKSEINILFVPQLNKDTNYFSSIVESASRDLHCYIVQANTSTYGDSRITAPFKTDYKNIIQIKGGINDIVIIGEIDIKALQKFQDNYEKRLEAAIKTCFKCKRIQNKTAKLAIEICKKCRYSFEKGIIKGTPPNFVNTND